MQATVPPPGETCQSAHGICSVAHSSPGPNPRSGTTQGKTLRGSEAKSATSQLSGRLRVSSKSWASNISLHRYRYDHTRQTLRQRLAALAETRNQFRCGWLLGSGPLAATLDRSSTLLTRWRFLYPPWHIFCLNMVSTWLLANTPPELNVRLKR